LTLQLLPGTTLADKVLDVLDSVDDKVGANASPAVSTATPLVNPGVSLSALLAEARESHSAPKPATVGPSASGPSLSALLAEARQQPPQPQQKNGGEPELGLQDLFASVAAPVLDVVGAIGKSAFQVIGHDLTAKAHSQRAARCPAFDAAFEDVGAAALAALVGLASYADQRVASLQTRTPDGVTALLQASHYTLLAISPTEATLAETLEIVRQEVQGVSLTKTASSKLETAVSEYEKWLAAVQKSDTTTAFDVLHANVSDVLVFFAFFVLFSFFLSFFLSFF
jgi:hypothetical protein